MSHEPRDPRTSGTKLLPDDLSQNPAPLNLKGQSVLDTERSLANRILSVFLSTLPSNYVSQSNGPQYVLQFQSIAEQMAKLQLSALEYGQDSDFDFTRPEFIYQFLASLVFPDGDLRGLPNIQGDVSYRDFLKRMIRLLLQGATSDSVLQAVKGLSFAEVTLTEGFKGQGDLSLEQFSFEVDVSKNTRTDNNTTSPLPTHSHTVHINTLGQGTTVSITPEDPSSIVKSHTHEITDFQVGEALGHSHKLLSQFAEDPFILDQNIYLALKALKPAHTLYQYRNLFREIVGSVFDDTSDWTLQSFYYDDFRKYCRGAKFLSGISGDTLTDRTLFTDPTRSFRNVSIGSLLYIVGGANNGSYRIREVLSILFDDIIERSYITSPTGLSGKATVIGGVIKDPLINFATTVEGETLTFIEGLNAGTYRLERVLGNNGGLVGFAVGPSTEVSPAPSTLRLERRMLTALSGQTYEIGLERLGVQTPKAVSLEDVSVQFETPPLPPATPISTLTVSKGPLVKGWGDATPATDQDVEVLLNGVAVSVDSVNPYTGEITLTVPITTFAPGVSTVEVNYQWFLCPTMSLAGLNTLGLTLNTWNLPSGRNATTLTPSGLGGASTTVFYMRVTLGTYPIRDSPVLIGHRFIGFDKSYTASINSPTSLVLNAPNRASVPYARAEKESQKILFEGKESPAPPWVQVGSLSGSSDDVVYTLTNPSNTTVGYVVQPIDLKLKSSVTSVARLQITDFDLDGVFTGVGFGFHDNRRIYFAGALVVNGVKHIGILAREGQLNLIDSWIVGPNTSGTLLTQTTVEFSTEDLPFLFDSGDRFQVLSGNQTGIYIITGVVKQANGTTVVTVDSPFPADLNLFGNNPITAFFETLWENLSTWKVLADTETETASVQFGGSTQGSIFRTITGKVIASPAYLATDITPSKSGQFLWGSIGRKQTNTTVWDFVRYVGIPTGVPLTRGTIVEETMTIDPLEDSPEDWFLTSPFGHTEVSGGQLNILNGVSSTTIEATSGYERTDAFLHGKRVISTEGSFQMTQFSKGAGDAQIRVRDGIKDIVLGSILYFTDGSGNHSISTQSIATLGGFDTPTNQGWSDSGYSGFAYGPHLQINKGLIESWTLTQNMNPTPTITSKIIDFELSIDTFSANASNRTGLAVGVFYNNRFLQLNFINTAGVAGIQLNDSLSTSINFDWSDGQYHKYKIEADGGIVSISADGVLILAGILVFPLSSESYDTVISALNIGGDCSFSARLKYLTVLDLSPFGLPTGTNPTMGIWKGGDKTDIDNWSLPRTDGLSVPNSDPTATIVTMDWYSASIQTRLFVDPEYGAGLERPDLALPAGYVAGDFATQSMNPSACWAVVEYADLPAYEETFGSISFGALESDSISDQIWERPFEYKFFTNTTQDFAASQGMFLNRYNVVSSGDFNRDITPEVYTVNSYTDTLVLLQPIHIFADRIFFVSVDGVNLNETDWSFDKESQSIQLVDPLPFQNYPVQVTFAPDKPITTTYLQNQRTLDSAIPLNEGTPIFEKSMQTDFSNFVVSGSEGQVRQGSFEIAVGFTIQDGDRVVLDASSIPFIQSYVFLVAGTDFLIGANENDTASNLEVAINASSLSSYVVASATLNVVSLNTTSLVSLGNEYEKFTLQAVENTTGSIIVNGSGSGPSVMTPLPYSPTLGNPQFVLGDPYRSVKIMDTLNSSYESMEFFEVSDSGYGGLITIACDDICEYELNDGGVITEGTLP